MQPPPVDDVAAVASQSPPPPSDQRDVAHAAVLRGDLQFVDRVEQRCAPVAEQCQEALGVHSVSNLVSHREQGIVVVVDGHDLEARGFDRLDQHRTGLRAIETQRPADGVRERWEGPLDQGVGEREPTAGAEYPVHLRERQTPLRDETEDALGEDDVSFAVLFFQPDPYCTNCRQQVQDVDERIEDFHGGDADVVPIVPEPRARVADWQATYGLSVPLLADVDADVDADVADAYDQPVRFGVLSRFSDFPGRMPEVVIVDRRGPEPPVAVVHRGSSTFDRPDLDELLGELDELRGANPAAFDS